MKAFTKTRRNLSSVGRIFSWGAFFLFASAGLAWASNDVPPRVSFIDGSAAYEPAGEVDWSEVTINLPLLSGDRLISHPDSRLELELGYGNFLRVGQNSDLTVRRTGDLEFDLAVGDVIVRINDSTRFKIHTPNAVVQLRKKGLYRISVDESGGLRVAVRKGEAEVANGFRERKVKTGEEIFVADPQASLSAVTYLSREDAFDSWSDRRDAQFVYASSTQYVGGSYAGVYDLDRYGEWQYVSAYGGSVWFPYASYSGWAPYRVGRWAHYPTWGWTWISHEPWGWLPYHYGSWVYYRPYSRWCWIPSGFGFWSGSLVDFYFGGGYVGWAPRRWHGHGGGSSTNVTNVNIINNNNTVVNNNGWNRAGPRDGLTVVSERDFVSRRPDHALVDDSNRSVVERLNPGLPQDLPDRRSTLRSTAAAPAAAGASGPRVVTAGSASPRGVASRTEETSRAPGSSWVAPVRNPGAGGSSPAADQTSTRGTTRFRSPSASAPSATSRPNVDRGGAVGDRGAPTVRQESSPGSSWFNRGGSSSRVQPGSSRPSSVRESPSTVQRTPVAPNRSSSRPFVTRAPSRPSGVTPSSRPSSAPRTVTPRSPVSRPPVARPPATSRPPVARPPASSATPVRSSPPRRPAQEKPPE